MPLTSPGARERAAALAIAQERAGGGTPDTYWRGGGGYHYESSPEGVLVTRPDGRTVQLGWDHPLIGDILEEQGTRAAEFGVRPQASGAGQEAPPTGEPLPKEATGKEAPYWQARDLPRAEFAYTGNLAIPGAEGRTLADVFTEPGVFVPPDAPDWDRTAWTGPATNRELEEAIRLGRVEQLGMTESGQPVWTYEGRVNPQIGGEEAAEMARIQKARSEQPAQERHVKTYAAKAKTPPTQAPPRSARGNIRDALQAAKNAASKREE